jgi:hypothetical protein
MVIEDRADAIAAADALDEAPASENGKEGNNMFIENGEVGAAPAAEGE